MGLYFLEKNCHKIYEKFCLSLLKAKLLFPVCHEIPCTMNGDTAEENTPPRLHPLTRCPQRPDAFCKKAHSGNFPFELQLCNFAVDIKEARKFSLHSPNVHGSFEVMRTGQEEFSINFCNLFKKDTIFPIYRFLELCLWQIPIKLNG